jgi:hypothetical protein
LSETDRFRWIWTPPDDVGPSTRSSSIHKLSQRVLKKPNPAFSECRAAKLRRKRAYLGRAEDVSLDILFSNICSEIVPPRPRSVIPCGRRSIVRGPGAVRNDAAVCDVVTLAEQFQFSTHIDSIQVSRDQTVHRGCSTLRYQNRNEQHVRCREGRREERNEKGTHRCVEDLHSGVSFRLVGRALCDNEPTGERQSCKCLKRISVKTVRNQLFIRHQMAGGIPKETRDAWPMLPKLFTGLCFPSAICFIVFLGCELFTGVSFPHSLRTPDLPIITWTN